MSREAKYVVSRLLEIDARRRFRAYELIREPWIQCQDLPLSVFETAGGLFRANSVDARNTHSMKFKSDHGGGGPLAGPRSGSMADNFNRGIARIHVKAMDHLKSLGFSQ